MLEMHLHIQYLHIVDHLQKNKDRIQEFKESGNSR